MDSGVSLRIIDGWIFRYEGVAGGELESCEPFFGRPGRFGRCEEIRFCSTNGKLPGMPTMSERSASGMGSPNEERTWMLGM